MFDPVISRGDVLMPLLTIVGLVMLAPAFAFLRSSSAYFAGAWRRLLILGAPRARLELSERPLRPDVGPELARLATHLRITLRTIEPALERPHTLRDTPDTQVDGQIDDRFGDTIGVTGELWRWLLEAERLVVAQDGGASGSLEHVTRALRGMLFSAAPLHQRMLEIVALLVSFDDELRGPAPRLGYRTCQADGRLHGGGGSFATVVAQRMVARERARDTDDAGHGQGTSCCETGERDGEATLVAHDRRFRAVARRYADDEAAREDLQQEIRLAVWRALPAYRGEGSLRSYVMRIAHLCGARFARRQWRVDDEPEVIDVTSDLEDELELRRQRALVAQAMTTLPPGHRDALSLQLAGHAYREIADELGITESNVSARVTRARQTLARTIGEAGGKD